MRRVRAGIEAPLRDLIRWGLLTYWAVLCARAPRLQGQSRRLASGRCYLLSGWMQSGPRECLLAVVEAAGNDPEGFAVVADLVDQAVP